ncbi:anti-anti-sigma factor [Streptomyces bungoensis]|uniref:Anti-sigma factor antagonist n=1 Tax=Streptomyces bungoensis TaxID=285568 RepID=A0A101TAE2_9ACTN|nr:anti-anti-sigma factor [Streptomyces bungoensis]
MHGEIDIRAVLPLRARLDELTAGDRPYLVVDLRAVSFIDCAGLGLLCRARDRIGRRHGRLRVVTTGDRVPRVLRGAGLGSAFELYGSPAEAVAADRGTVLAAARG